MLLASSHKAISLTPPSVLVYLQSISARDDSGRVQPPLRTIELSAENDWTARVGRATTTGSGPDAGADNACYRSRVVSREHAYITADPMTRSVSITDDNSMHGTHVHGQRLTPLRPYPLEDKDVIVLGAAVERGDGESVLSIPSTENLHEEEVFGPVHVEVRWDWLHDASDSAYLQRHHASNTFTVPDYDSEDDTNGSSGDDDIIDTEARPFAVLDSEHSDEVESLASDEAVDSNVDSPSSSPIASHHSDELTTKSAPLQVVEVVTKPVDEPTVQQSGIQTGRSIAEVLENQAERMTTNDMGPDMLVENYTRAREDDSDHDEYRREEIDEFSEADEFENDAPPAPMFSPTLPIPALPQHRDPSPSDAAMVKPFNAGMQSNWANNYNWTQNLGTGNSGMGANPWNTWPAAPADGLYESSIFPTRDGYTESEFPTVEPSLYVQPVALSTNMLGHAPDHTRTTSPSGVTTTKHCPSPLMKARKRKADEVEEDDDEAIVPTSLIGSPIIDSVAATPEADAAVDSDSGEAPVITVSSVADIIKSPAPAQAESPRKKQKTHKHDRRSKRTSFTKYAVTALTGAAIGAVGTVLGLAALPQDFFV
jgi:hypothetical protein